MQSVNAGQNPASNIIWFLKQINDKNNQKQDSQEPPRLKDACETSTN